MPAATETELQLQQKSTIEPSSPTAVTGLMVEPVGLERTPEFQDWIAQKTGEVLRYLKLSFNRELPAEKLVFHSTHLGYPDPIGQLRTHARIWGYNYKINGETAINPATEQPMSYVVWQILDPPVMPVEVADPSLEFDQDVAPEDFEPEPVTAA